MPSPVIYVFLNKDLHMSVGKAASQAVHAAMNVPVDKKWNQSMQRTVIILEARDESHIDKIQRYLQERNLITYRVIDEGVNEIDPHTITALASQILDKDDPDVVSAFSSFNLYKDIVNMRLEFER